MLILLSAIDDKKGLIFKRHIELVSKELNHFGMIAGLFRQIGVIVVDLCYFALFEDFSL